MFERRILPRTYHYDSCDGVNEYDLRIIKPLVMEEIVKVSIGISNLKDENLDKLLEGVTFEIPFFQREYSWTRDMWTDFVEDIEQTIDNKDKGHFFGFMTFKPGEKVDYEIIEGQQRITTVVIFLCAVRDLSSELEFDKIENDIQNGFICAKRKWRNHQTPYPNLTLSHINKDFFRNIIQEQSTFRDKENKYKRLTRINPSNKLIFNCYKYFHDYLSNQINGLSLEEKRNKLNLLVEALLENLIVVVTEVTDNIVAYNIFQTLNDRGLDLALSDILKINLCHIVTKEKEFIENFWYDIRDHLVAGNMDKFLRHYWLSRYRVVKETRLLSDIQEQISNEQAAYDFLGELADEVDNYEALVKPTQDYWNRKDPDIAGLLDDMQVISAVIPLPLLMAASQCLETKEFIKVIKLCTTFLFRYLTIGEQESKELEKLFSDLAIKIRKKEIDKALQIKDALLDKNISNDLFKSLLLEKDIKLNKVARYILRNIEIYIEKDLEKFSEKITLEHILPKKPDEDWKKYLKENEMELELLVNKLGNMTLLLGKFNREASNMIFSKKNHLYNNSKLRINENLKNLQSWTKDDIMERQKYLAEYCLKVWKL